MSNPQPAAPKLAQRYRFIVQQQQVPSEIPNRKKMEIIAVAVAHPLGEWMKFEDVQTVMKALALGQINERAIYEAKITDLEKQISENS